MKLLFRATLFLTHPSRAEFERDEQFCPIMPGFGSVVLFLSQAQYLLMAPKPYGTASKFGDGIVPVRQLSPINFSHEERSSLNTKIRIYHIRPYSLFPNGYLKIPH